MARCRIDYVLLGSTLLLALPVTGTPAYAQRSGENAARQATDAFGFSVGGEAVGLYSTDSVRGFSPAAAGNIRMEGLYFDRQGYVSGRTVRSSTVRVGINTLGYLFPAPSGIADFSLRAPAETALSVTGGVGEYGSPFVDFDAGFASADGTLGAAFGASLHPDENSFRGTDNRYFNVGIVPRWQPSGNLTLIGYLDREQGRGAEVSPTYLTGGAYLPPRIDRGRFLGQSWAKYEFNSANEGLIAKLALPSGWSVRAGAFHSVFNPRSDAFDLVRDIRPDGSADRSIVLLPERRFASYSGDLQVERAWIAGRARHTITAGLRGRDFQGRYGGELVVPIGRYQLNEPVRYPAPQVAFDRPQSRDDVRQFTGGLAYRLEWRQKLDLAIGIQKADYRKAYTPGGGSIRANHSAPWLYDARAAWRFNTGLIAYASYARGLEESGTAPGNAVNVGEVLAAIETTQREIGVRATFGAFTLTTAAFDIDKPYAALDARDLFRLVGTVRHRGVEASLSGQPAPGLSVLAGVLVMDPRVTGEEVDAGLRGKRPTGQMPLLLQSNADYSLPFLDGLSIDASLAASGKRTSRRDGQADVPERALLSLGARYRFRLAGRPATLRGQIMNLFDTYGLSINGPGSYDYIAGRRWRLTIAADF